MNGIALAPAFVEGEWRQYLAGLQSYLDRVILGQTYATTRIAQTIQAAELGLTRVKTNSPKRAFFFWVQPGSARRSRRSVLRSICTVKMPKRRCSYETSTVRRRRSNHSVTGSKWPFEVIGTVRHFCLMRSRKRTPKIIDIFISLLWEGLFTARSGEKLCVEDFYGCHDHNLGSGDLARMENSPFSLMERTVFGVTRDRMRPELFASFYRANRI